MMGTYQKNSCQSYLDKKLLLNSAEHFKIYQETSNSGVLLSNTIAPSVYKIIKHSLKILQYLL